MNNSDMPAAPISLDLIRPACGESLPHAFPYGLTKREYFAGLAMQGVLASDTNFNLDKHDVADQAIQHADALLAKLENTK